MAWALSIEFGMVGHWSDGGLTHASRNSIPLLFPEEIVGGGMRAGCQELNGERALSFNHLRRMCKSGLWRGVYIYRKVHCPANHCYSSERMRGRRLMTTFPGTWHENGAVCSLVARFFDPTCEIIFRRHLWRGSRGGWGRDAGTFPIHCGLVGLYLPSLSSNNASQGKSSWDGSIHIPGWASLCLGWTRLRSAWLIPKNGHLTGG